MTPTYPTPAARRRCGLLLWTLLLAWSRVAAAEAPAPELVPVTMLVGFTPSAVAQGNRNDVEAGFKVLCESIGKRRGYLVTVKVRVFPDATEFHEAIAAGEINFAIFDSFSFLAERRRSTLHPVFLPATKGLPARRYLLIARRDSGAQTLGDLRGRRLVELHAPNISAAHPWLLSLLRAQGLQTGGGFFASIAQADRASAAVLPVFFGKQDACVVDELSFQLMVELNPEVGVRLQSLHVSEPLAGSVICVSETNWSTPRFRPALLQALVELHLDPAGRQMLDLFKIDRMAPFEESLLEPVKAIWAATASPAGEVAR